MLLIFLGYLHQLNFLKQHFSLFNSIAILMFFDKYFIEFLISLLLITILLKAHYIASVPGLIVLFVYVLANIIQFSSIYFGGEFITPLAIENIDSFYILFNVSNSVSLIFILIILLIGIPLLSVLINRYFSKISMKLSFRLTHLLILLSTVSFTFVSSNLPEDLQKRVNALNFEKNIDSFSPMKKLYSTLFSKTNIDASPKTLLNQVNIFKLKVNSMYPLIKKHRDISPFQAKKNKKKSNIIVFFTEGMSARVMGVYNNKFKALTPNLENFSQSSMKVENYYNHTAATYRGIIGQICSLFPTYGGYGGWTDNYKKMPEINYYGLTDILSENSYHTIFFNPKYKNMSRLDEMAKQIGFDLVLNAEDLSKKYLNGEQPLQKDAVSDFQLYTSLIRFLKNYEMDSHQTIKQPFFIALYNAETHAWYDIKKDGKKFGNGKNNTLNTIYNLDHSFGKFWKYYQSSHYSQNTIIVFTSDHAHFYDKSYVDVIKKYKEDDYQKLFVDKIPLIIHDPETKLPRSFDSRYSTSIDFAPSLVHFLGLKNERNPFLGESIFLPARNKAYGIASYGNQYYVIDKEKIHSMTNSNKFNTLLKIIQKNIKITQYLEISNRIWDESLSKKR